MPCSAESRIELRESDSFHMTIQHCDISSFVMHQPDEGIPRSPVAAVKIMKHVLGTDQTAVGKKRRGRDS